MNQVKSSKEGDKVRLDKWLWAARCYKTRALAAQAIRGGLVHYNGQRVKPSQNVSIGSEVWMRVGQVERTLQVIALAEKRQTAKIAELLYQETPESMVSRQNLSLLRQASKIIPGPKPSKRERRQRQRLVGR